LRNAAKRGSLTKEPSASTTELPMTQTADPLVVDFVEWIAREPRPYSEVIAIWRTSCPRLTIWEDAADFGYVERQMIDGRGMVVTVTKAGEKLLRAHARPG
jgi:hypothetical protein